MNIKQKVGIKIQQMNIDIFFNQILLETIDCLFSVYLNRNNDVERFKTRRYYLSKGIIVNYNVIINGKTFMTKQLIEI